MAQLLERHNLYAFSSRTLADLLDIDAAQVSKILTRMGEENLVAKIERGKYLLLGLNPERVLSNPAFIGSQMVVPAYLSYWSALNYYGYTEQVPAVVQIAVTRRKRAIEFRGKVYHFIHLDPKQFFGYRRDMLGELPVVVADEAKAIIDSLHKPKHAGGIAEVGKALKNAVDDLDIDTLVTYANRMGSRSLCARLGYLLEILGVPSQGLEVANGPVSLDPTGPRSGEYNQRWRLYINRSKDEMFPEGAG